MSIEKGINRIGTVVGVIFGFILGIFSMVHSFEGLDSQISLGRSDAGYVLIALFALGLAGFLIGFSIIKIVGKTINWIIKGFRE